MASPVSVIWSASLSEQESKQLDQFLSESGLKPGAEGFEQLIRQLLSGEFGDDDEDNEDASKTRRFSARTDAIEQLLRDHGPMIAQGARIGLKILSDRFKAGNFPRS